MRVASRSAAPRLPAAGEPWLYALGLGSNRRHGRHGAPAAVLRTAIEALAGAGLRVVARSPLLATPPLGPGGRRYANAAVLVEAVIDPATLLDRLKAIERAFGRRRGRRWGARVLDLDILLWSGGRWRHPDLHIPHAGLARRRFVLDPLAAIAPDWPVAGPLRVRHLRARLTRERPLHRGCRTVGL